MIASLCARRRKHFAVLPATQAIGIASHQVSRMVHESAMRTCPRRLQKRVIDLPVQRPSNDHLHVDNQGSGERKTVTIMVPLCDNVVQNVYKKPMVLLGYEAPLFNLVPKKGLEPPHPCGYMDLNHARLPIPPLRRGKRTSQTETRCVGNTTIVQVVLLMRNAATG